MTYWTNSVCYRALAGSWLLGWLVRAPEDRSQVFLTSIAYKLSRSCLDRLAAGLQHLGKPINRVSQGSFLVQNPLGFLGLLMFFYFGFDLMINQHSLLRTLLEYLLLISGLLLPFIAPRPGVWEGSLAGRLLGWWRRTE